MIFLVCSLNVSGDENINGMAFLSIKNYLSNRLLNEELSSVVNDSKIIKGNKI